MTEPVDVTVGEIAPRGVDRQCPIQVQGTTGGEGAAFAALAEAIVFELHEHGDGEAVVELRNVDVLWAHSGETVEPIGERGTGIGQGPGEQVAP